MSFTKTIIGLTLSLLLGSGVAVAADYDKGYEAWLKGDYKAALADWIPLAEQGNAKAQCKLGYMHDNGKRSFRKPYGRFRVGHQICHTGEWLVSKLFRSDVRTRQGC